MLKTHWRLISRIERLGDNFVVIGAFLLAYYLRDLFLRIAAVNGLPSPQDIKDLGPINDYLIVLGMGLPTFYALLAIFGGYQRLRFASVLHILRIIVLTTVTAFLCLGSFLFLLKLDLSRSFVAIFCGVSGALLFFERVIVLKLLHYWRRKGKNFRNLLIVGTGAQAEKLFWNIAEEPELGVRVAGFVTYQQDGVTGDSVAAGQSGMGMPFHAQVNGAPVMLSPNYPRVEVLHSLENGRPLPVRIVASPATFESVLKKYAIDEVLFTDVMPHFQSIKELAQLAVDEGIRATLVADFFSMEIFKSEVSYFHSLPLIHFQPSPGENSALFMKRVIDVGVSATLIAALSPVMLLAAAAIRLESAGPVFFRQRRVGLNGRTFVLYKFRSMVRDAERMLPSLRKLNEMDGPVFKMRHDPRVTRVGRWLRRFSIDELPQLFNVLRGDMSLVGPRPPLPEEVSLYARKQRRRLSMRPGITCTWQVSGRNEIPDFERWAKLDLEYIDTWSLSQDFKLMLRTIPAVLSGFGAR